MNKTDQLFIDRWGNTRETSRSKRTLKRGLIFGLALFIVNGFFNREDKSTEEMFFTSQALMILGVYIAFGLIYHHIQWWWNEKTYNKIIARNEEA